MKIRGKTYFRHTYLALLPMEIIQLIHISPEEVSAYSALLSYVKASAFRTFRIALYDDCFEPIFEPPFQTFTIYLYGTKHSKFMQLGSNDTKFSRYIRGDRYDDIIYDNSFSEWRTTHEILIAKAEIQIIIDYNPAHEK
jgi:hypothetical protein